MKTIAYILLFAFAAGAQANPVAEINCQSKIYECDRSGTHCNWVLVSGQPIGYVLLQQDADGDIWRGTYIRDFDGHRLILKVRYDQQLDQNGQSEQSVRTSAEVWTPQVSAETTGSNRIDIGLHNQTYGRGFFCRSIKITN